MDTAFWERSDLLFSCLLMVKNMVKGGISVNCITCNIKCASFHLIIFGVGTDFHKPLKAVSYKDFFFRNYLSWRGQKHSLKKFVRCTI